MKKYLYAIKVTALSVVCVISLTLASASITSFVYQNRVLPRTAVAGEKLSNKSVLSASEQVSQLLTEAQSKIVNISYQDKQYQFKQDDLGISVSSASAISQINHSSSMFEFVYPSYWKNFFAKKDINLAVNIDQNKMLDKIRSTVELPGAPSNAEIKVEKGQLVVSGEKSGYEVSTALLTAGIETALNSNSAPSVPLVTEEKSATVLADEANAAKQEIEGYFKPITVQIDTVTATIPVGDQYGWLDFTTENNKISWKINQAKISTYLQNSIVAKYNVKMVQRSVGQDGAVQSDGREGREINAKALLSAILSIVNAPSATNAPITAEIKTIAVTDKIVTPNYVLGLFPGKYIEVNLAKQKLYTIVGDTLIREYTVSTGKWSMPTPTGTYSVQSKNPRAYSGTYGLYMPFWMAFIGNKYGIHALPEWPNGYKEGESHLGIPVSHGCIRLSDANAEEVYNWSEVGTTVYIF